MGTCSSIYGQPNYNNMPNSGVQSISQQQAILPPVTFNAPAFPAPTFLEPAFSPVPNFAQIPQNFANTTTPLGAPLPLPVIPGPAMPPQAQLAPQAINQPKIIQTPDGQIILLQDKNRDGVFNPNPDQGEIVNFSKLLAPPPVPTAPTAPAVPTTPAAPKAPEATALKPVIFHGPNGQVFLLQDTNHDGSYNLQPNNKELVNLTELLGGKKPEKTDKAEKPTAEHGPKRPGKHHDIDELLPHSKEHTEKTEKLTAEEREAKAHAKALASQLPSLKGGEWTVESFEDEYGDLEFKPVFTHPKTGERFIFEGVDEENGRLILQGFDHDCPTGDYFSLPVSAKGRLDFKNIEAADPETLKTLNTLSESEDATESEDGISTQKKPRPSGKHADETPNLKATVQADGAAVKRDGQTYAIEADPKAQNIIVGAEGGSKRVYAIDLTQANAEGIHQVGVQGDGAGNTVLLDTGAGTYKMAVTQPNLANGSIIHLANATQAELDLATIAPTGKTLTSINDISPEQVITVVGNGQTKINLRDTDNDWFLVTSDDTKALKDDEKLYIHPKTGEVYLIKGEAEVNFSQASKA